MPQTSLSQIHGILIGVDHYLKRPGGTGKAKYSCLSGAVNDVKRVRLFLTEELGVPEKNLSTLTSSRSREPEPLESIGQRPTYENMTSLFQRVAARVERGDHVIVHYSGHGGRVPTAFPNFKGEDAADECLVPWNIADPDGRYLRDLELRHLVSLLTRKGAGVTLILDCCHAGGALRRPEEVEARGWALRGGRELDEIRRQPGSIVSEREVLDRWPELGGETAREVDGESWRASPPGTVLFAACRPRESAFEATIDGVRSGALTHYWLAAIRRAGPHWSNETLYHVLQAEIHARFSRQTPVLEGEGSWRLLSQEPREPLGGIAVTSVTTKAGETRIVLLAGSAQGIRQGARFDLFTSALDHDLLAEAEVIEVGATSSQARLQRLKGKRLPEAGDFAVLSDPGKVVLRRGVALQEAASASPLASPRRLRTFFQRFGQGFLELAEPARADLHLTVDRGGCCELVTSTGDVLLDLGLALEWQADEDLRKVVERMLHWARFCAVASLAPSDPFSPLGGALEAELRRMGESLDPAALAQPDSMPISSPEESVATGQWLCLVLHNRSQSELNYAALTLLEDFAIEQLFPGPSDGPFGTIGPGETIPLPFQVERTLPGRPSRDRLRIFVSHEPCSFRWLELPPLGEPLPGIMRAASQPAGLPELYDAFTGETLERRPVASRRALSGWSVVDLELVVD